MILDYTGVFTKEELERANVNQLKQMAWFLSIKLPKRIKKGELIEKILEQIEEDVPGTDNLEIPKSVRISRIDDQNN